MEIQLSNVFLDVEIAMIHNLAILVITDILKMAKILAQYVMKVARLVMKQQILIVLAVQALSFYKVERVKIAMMINA